MRRGAPTSKCGSRRSAGRWGRHCRLTRRRGRDDNASISPRQVLKAGAMTAESQQGATGANSAAAAANTDHPGHAHHGDGKLKLAVGAVGVVFGDIGTSRSEEHTSELQSLMRLSYAVFCLKKKNKTHEDTQQMDNSSPSTR